MADHVLSTRRLIRLDNGTSLLNWRALILLIIVVFTVSFYVAAFNFTLGNCMNVLVPTRTLSGAEVRRLHGIVQLSFQ